MNKNKLNVSERFLEERKKINLNRSKFAKLSGISESTLRRWENGSEIPASVLPTLKEAGLDVDYIITGEYKEPINLILPDTAIDNFKEIPLYPDEIAAGQPLEIRDQPEGIVVIHKDWCKQPEHMVAVRVSSTGESMQPTIPAGAIVTIDTTPTTPEALLGEVVAIQKKDDGATIKRLTKTSRGLCGVPDNRDPIHDVIIIEEGDRIIGRVNSVHYVL